MELCVGKRTLRALRVEQGEQVVRRCVGQQLKVVGLVLVVGGDVQGNHALQKRLGLCVCVCVFVAPTPRRPFSSFFLLAHKISFSDLVFLNPPFTHTAGWYENSVSRFT